MKKIILILIILLTYNINAQECGTQITTTNQVFNIAQNNDTQFCVSIKFHIVRETNGTGGFDASQIQNVINYINQFYNPHSINVSSIGFDYINNSNLNTFDDAEFSQLTAINNVPYAINFYIVNTAPYNGRAGGIISNNLVIRVDKVLAPTSPHELGHCFNLLHTFQGTASGTSGCAEKTNGSNCSSCGDNVCDTAADANIGATGGFNPDLTNTMSYYTTRDHFTVLQGLRMRNAIGGSSILQATLSSQCTSIVGISMICANSNYQYILSNPQNINIIWTTTSNLEIVYSSNTGVTIKTINSTINGQGTITANLNGILVTKTIWIGIPSKPTIVNYSCSNDSYDAPCYLYLTPNNNYFTFSLTAEFGNYTPLDTDWQWEKDSGNFNFLENGQYNGTSHIGNTGNIYITGANPTNNPLQFKCRVRNTCGWSDWKTFIWNDGTTTTTPPPTPPEKYYVIAPNPTGGYAANISLLNPLIVPSTTSPIIIKLYTIFGQLLSTTQMYTNSSGTVYVYSFPYNTMWISITFDNHTETHTILK